MAHNPTKYPRPFDFLPERFLADDGTLKPDDTQHIAFGFGRRMCVGRHFADTSVWTAIAAVLAVFELGPPRDGEGRDVPVVPRFTSGLAVCVRVRFLRFLGYGPDRVLLDIHFRFRVGLCRGRGWISRCWSGWWPRVSFESARQFLLDVSSIGYRYHDDARTTAGRCP